MSSYIHRKFVSSCDVLCCSRCSLQESREHREQSAESALSRDFFFVPSLVGCSTAAPLYRLFVQSPFVFVTPCCPDGSPLAEVGVPLTLLAVPLVSASQRPIKGEAGLPPTHRPLPSCLDSVPICAVFEGARIITCTLRLCTRHLRNIPRPGTVAVSQFEIGCKQSFILARVKGHVLLKCRSHLTILQ